MRTYVIFNTSELNKIDFTQVLETSIDTVRKSLDNNKTFVKWEGATPSCISNLSTIQGVYDVDGISNILSGIDWSPDTP